MTDETESSLETKQSRLEVIKEQITKANGYLIPLGKTTADGKRLFLAVSHLRKHPEDKAESRVNSHFWGWEEDRSLQKTAVLLIDVYVYDGGKISPLGHMDWWIHGDYANGGGNMHDALNPQTEYEKLAKRRWHKYDSTAFKVDYDFHKQGLGSLMVAASAVALQAVG